ncbi:hypothetical protein HU200_001059 [Digitaria exilis]|uniref:Uncharacterized protein n=1 Tax=Digitaria exilis TaxID=1010633 RepID=A0A835FZV1_9POAL|nr:hypothetical protein HU200_001059 [Digitaria exilis]
MMSPVQQQPKKYLHLLLNDWDSGYSIYRVGDEDFNMDTDMEAPRAAASLLIRIVAQHGYSWSFVSHGTKIMAMNPAVSSPGIPVFDTKTLAMTVCPRPLSGDCGSKPLYASVGDRLLAFVYPFLEVLGPEPPHTEESWSWTRGIDDEPMPPFNSSRVSSYAVHPDGRTIFVSVKCYKLNPGLCPPYGDRSSTFTFDMESHEWTHIGDWILPFRGRAYYDHELDAWVGLFSYKGKTGHGHVCCCDVPPAATGSMTTMPVWKLGVERFFDDSSERHLGATLVYMDNSRFCLVESVMPKDDDFYPRLRVVKMTSFMLKYGKEGELRVSGRCTYASMAYRIPHKHMDVELNPVAFWM